MMQSTSTQYTIIPTLTINFKQLDIKSNEEAKDTDEPTHHFNTPTMARLLSVFLVLTNNNLELKPRGEFRVF